MMLAARGAFLAARRNRKPTARSYVQDGLVAQYDGIENAGFGVHDPAATTWVDLSGNGLDLILTDNAVVDAASVVSKYAYRKAVAYSQPHAFYLGDVQTIEVVCTGWKDNSTGVDYFSLGTLSTASRYGNVSVRNGILAGNCHNLWQKGVPVSMVADGKAHSVVFNFASAGTGNYGATRAYVDGVEVVLQSMSNGKDGGSGRITVGGAYASSGYMAVDRNVKFHAIRLSSRQLSASEIAANYAIDKARFNLP